MIKYKKEEVHRVNMCGRLEIKIIHEEIATSDETEWENEIARINEKMQKYMQRYEENLRTLISSALSDTQKYNNKDADYFIGEYSSKFIGRNPDNIKNRLDIYGKYLETKN